MAVFRVNTKNSKELEKWMVDKLLDLGAREFAGSQGLSERDPDVIMIRLGNLDTSGPFTSVKDGDRAIVNLVCRDFTDKREVNHFTALTDANLANTFATFDKSLLDKKQQFDNRVKSTFGTVHTPEYFEMQK